jgi:hypothetical protein
MTQSAAKWCYEDAPEAGGAHEAPCRVGGQRDVLWAHLWVSRLHRAGRHSPPVHIRHASSHFQGVFVRRRDPHPSFSAAQPLGVRCALASSSLCQGRDRGSTQSFGGEWAQPMPSHTAATLYSCAHDLRCGLSTSAPLPQHMGEQGAKGSLYERDRCYDHCSSEADQPNQASQTVVCWQPPFLSVPAAHPRALYAGLSVSLL